MSEEYEKIHHNPVTALVPEDIGLGYFATEVVIFHGENEVALDFIQGVAKPYRVVSRIILSNNLAKRFFNDLKEEIIEISQNVKQIPSIVEFINEEPKEDEEKEGVEQIYKQLKLMDEQLKGVYANKILLTYGKDTFCMDFINNTYPKSIVTSRIFMSLNRSLELLGALKKITKI